MPTSLSLFDLKPGKTLLDRYQILRPHRESGIAATFVVEDGKDGVQKELLAYPAGLFESREQAAQFAERMLPWCELEVEGLCALHRVEALDDGAVLAIGDFPPGRSLRTRVEEHGPMDQREVVSLGTSVLRALGQVHDAGLVHGDIKPAAIHLTQDGGALLVDAGITPAMWAAKHLGTRTALIGTPYYAPIEQFTGDSPDELSDLYNLSTVLYELLTGVLPWSGKGYIEVFQSKLLPRPPAMSERAPGVRVSPELEEVIATGLSAERRSRHLSAGAYLEALQSVDVAAA